MPLIFLGLLTLGVNVRERVFNTTFIQENVYSFKQLEEFVGSVSPYTSVLDEEPSLVAEELAFDSAFIDQEFLEKPLLVNSETVLTSVAPTSEPVRTKIETYEVASSDTISGIAKKFGISIKTLAFANDLSSVDKIKPGQKLLIPPADGVVVTVSSGDTISSLAKKYRGDLNLTLKYNAENIKIGQRVLIVGGQQPMPAPTRVASARNVITRDRPSTVSTRASSGGIRPRNGWCTSFVIAYTGVGGNWGNAGSWLSSARRSGYSTGSEPVAGAIIVTRESPWGHVGVIESVHKDAITIVEQNYEGYGIISRRTISKQSSFIKGYVYR